MSTVTTESLVQAGPLRYVRVDHPHWHDDLSTDLRVEGATDAMRAACASMEFDAATCGVCSGWTRPGRPVALIGDWLDMDPETTVDVGRFTPFYVAQVGDGPAVLLCEDCAGVVLTLLPEPVVTR